MECVEKRVLLWNEPQCDSGSFETLKKLFGGDTCNVKVKYESDAILSKTPIIVLCNYDPFPKDIASVYVCTKSIGILWIYLDKYSFQN